LPWWQFSSVLAKRDNCGLKFCGGGFYDDPALGVSYACFYWGHAPKPPGSASPSLGMISRKQLMDFISFSKEKEQKSNKYVKF
jgi:hypothetical protein